MSALGPGFQLVLHCKPLKLLLRGVLGMCAPFPGSIAPLHKNMERSHSQYNPACMHGPPPTQTHHAHTQPQPHFLPARSPPALSFRLPALQPLCCVVTCAALSLPEGSSATLLLQPLPAWQRNSVSAGAIIAFVTVFPTEQCCRCAYVSRVIPSQCSPDSLLLHACKGASPFACLPACLLARLASAFRSVCMLARPT